ncbi:MAG: hypothetical protein ACREQQ_07975 [Candidatus Binatia bacterium]
MLHDVGVHVSHSKHHRHSHYLITHSELDGFRPEEIRLIAAIARFHRGAEPKSSHKDLAEFGLAERKLVIELAAILRIADGLDRSHRGLVKDLRVLRHGSQVTTEVGMGGRNAVLELWNAEQKADLAERCFDLEIRFRVRGGGGRRLAG